MDTEKEKTLTILNLMLKKVIEDGEWKRFVRKMRRHCAENLDIDVPETIEFKGLDHACRLLYDLLGHPIAMQAVTAIQGSLAYCSDTEDGDEPGRSYFTSSSDEQDSSPFMSAEEEEEEESDRDDNDGASTEPVNGPDEVAAGEAQKPLQMEELVDVTPIDSPTGDEPPADSDEEESVADSPRSVVPAGCGAAETENQLLKHFDKGPNMKRHTERMAMMLQGALKDMLEFKDDQRLTVENVQFQLERFIFNPPRGIPPEIAEVRYNFYPPFVLPKAICNYHIFSMTAPIPRSCKANRYGTELLQQLRSEDHFKHLPKWRLGVEIDDGLGDEVTPVGELQEDTKLVPLEEDISRLQWAKQRGEHILFFSYPSLHMPPKISRMLLETLVQPFADEHQKDESPMAVSDEELAAILDPHERMSRAELNAQIHKRRSIVAMALRYCVELELMQRIFREPSSVKKAQEVLHHTFHHGFVRLVRDVSRVNLSNFVTFHGVTYNNPLNNSITANLLEGIDKEDFVVDSIYLFLVLTWQTAMGMWQQAIDDTTVNIYRQAFENQRRYIYSLGSVNEVTNAIVSLLMDGDRLTAEMRKALPNFTSLSQIGAFRHFMLERSNIPSFAATFLPSDFVPLAFKQSQPILWGQVYLLRLAYYLTNHGGYLWEPEEDSPTQTSYCPCNLCSPHRMPQDNVALHNEILAIDTFEIQNPEGKTFKLTPEIWVNAYLDVFVPEEYHPFGVTHFRQHRSSFKKAPNACVTSSPEIFSLIRQIKENREEFLLNKGKGTYKDPKTGEVISDEVRPARHQAGLASSQALPALGAHQRRGALPPPTPPKLIRPRHGEHGPKNVGEDALRQEEASQGRARLPDAGRGHRRRVPRQSGYRHGGRRGGRGGGRLQSPEPGRGGGRDAALPAVAGYAAETAQGQETAASAAAHPAPAQEDEKRD